MGSGTQGRDSLYEVDYLTDVSPTGVPTRTPTDTVRGLGKRRLGLTS